MTQNLPDPRPTPPMPADTTPTQMTDSAGQTCLVLPKTMLPGWVHDYIEALTGGATDEWCKCTWNIHPDDRNIRPDCCRVCGDLRDYHEVAAMGTGHCKANDCACTGFFPRRMRRKDDSPTCPAHHKEGLILGFLEWLYT